MNDKFSQFDWKCWKDEKPEKDRYVYVYFPKDNHVLIGEEDEFNWDENCYWCYVFMPDPPKVGKRKLKPADCLHGCTNNYILALEDRIEKLEKHLNDLIASKPIMIGTGTFTI